MNLPGACHCEQLNLANSGARIAFQRMTPTSGNERKLVIFQPEFPLDDTKISQSV